MRVETHSHGPSYIETGGKGAVVKPWVWVSWLFLGPMLNSLLFNRYLYIEVELCFFHSPNVDIF